MASYKDWKPTFKDVKELNELLSAASDAVSDAFTALTKEAGMDAEIVSSILPQFDYYGTTNVSELHDSFYNRADFNREKSRLRRIIRAAEGKPRKGTVSPVEDGNQLTAFYRDEYGNPTITQYARNESSFLRSQERRRAMKNLAEQGISFVRKTVVDLLGRPVYDENRHKVTVMVPETPSMMSKYREEIQKHPEDAITYDYIGEETYIDMWGDMVPTLNMDRHQMSMQEMREAVKVDIKEAQASIQYFENYQLLLNTTMPNIISDEIGRYIDEINALPPFERSEIYDIIKYNEDDAGTIEFLYWDMSQGLAEKMTNILDFWRKNIAPILGYGDLPDAEEDMVQEELMDYGYTAAGIHPVFAEFQIRRADEPKGKWRKAYRSGGYA